LPFFILGCNDKYIINIYDKEQIKQPIKCLNLLIEPSSIQIEQNIKKLYNFSSNCQNTLKIRYKSDIVCTSPYSTKKNSSVFPTSFVELSIIRDEKTIYSCYKDLTSEDIDDEIEKAYYKIKNNLNF
jgi:hypothetical protein